MRRYHNSSTGRFLSRRAIVDLTISGYLDKEECIIVPEYKNLLDNKEETVGEE